MDVESLKNEIVYIFCDHDVSYGTIFSTYDKFVNILKDGTNCAFSYLKIRA